MKLVFNARWKHLQQTVKDHFDVELDLLPQAMAISLKGESFFQMRAFLDEYRLDLNSLFWRDGILCCRVAEYDYIVKRTFTLSNDCMQSRLAITAMIPSDKRIVENNIRDICKKVGLDVINILVTDHEMKINTKCVYREVLQSLREEFGWNSISSKGDMVVISLGMYIPIHWVVPLDVLQQDCHE